VNRFEALRKVTALSRLAARTSSEEADSAEAKAIELRLKYGISDAEVAAEVRDEADDVVFFGHRLMYYVNKIDPHVKRIAEEIDVAMAKIDELDPQNRLKEACRFYLDIRKLVEKGSANKYFGIDQNLQVRRNAVVKAYYEHERATIIARHRDPSMWPDGYDFGEPDPIRVHDHALTYTARHSDLRKDTVENIVGVHLKKLYERQWKMMAAEEAETEESND